MFGAGRVSKDDPRVAAYGRVDECSAYIGWAAVACANDTRQRLEQIQNMLFNVGADLATPHDSQFRGRLSRLVQADDVTTLERWIDEYAMQTPELRAFVLPGGTEAGARLHVARCACRSAERDVVSLALKEEVRSEVLAYLNRLSDFLFAAARFENHRGGVADVVWEQA